MTRGSRLEVGKVYTGTFGTAAVHERLLRLPEFIARRDADPHRTRMGEPSNDNDTMLLRGQPAALAVALQGFARLGVAAASAAGAGGTGPPSSSTTMSRVGLHSERVAPGA